MASIISPSMPIPAPGSSYAMERKSHFQPLPGALSSIRDAMFQEKREGSSGWSKIRGMDFRLATRSLQVCICSWCPLFGDSGLGLPVPTGDGGPLPVGRAMSLSPVTLKKVFHGIGYPLSQLQYSLSSLAQEPAAAAEKLERKTEEREIIT